MSAATQILPNFPSMMPSMVSEVRILSVSPIPLSKTQSLGHCQYTFNLEAQPRDGYQILTVADTYQLIRSGFDELSDSNPTPTLQPAPISAPDLAQSLVSEWNRSISPVGNFGVYMMPDGLIEGTPEFEETLRILTNQVKQLAEYAISDANDKDRNGDSKNISNGFHRALAKWLYGDQAIALTWYNAQNIDKMKKCLKCGESIKYEAKGCKSCGVDLIEYYTKYQDGLSPSDDPVVSAIVRRMQAPKQTEGTHTKAESTPLSIKPNVGTSLPAEARVLLVNALSGEQKSEMSGKKGQMEKDDFLVSLIPDLCMKNRQLLEAMTAKGYVVSNPN
jgi:predicted  nucleic acid-binding Zn-ribbon protein